MLSGKINDGLEKISFRKAFCRIELSYKMLYVRGCSSRDLQGCHLNNKELMLSNLLPCCLQHHREQSYEKEL